MSDYISRQAVLRCIKESSIRIFTVLIYAREKITHGSQTIIAVMQKGKKYETSNKQL